MERETKYKSLLKVVDSVVDSNNKLISNMANISALLKSEFDFHWVGFYLVDETKNELYLGPFQGPLACTMIPFGKGVCGTSWEKKKILNISNVHEFSGHIACSALTESEIVVPVYGDSGEIIAILDIDSTHLNDFNEVDELFLEKVCSTL